MGHRQPEKRSWRWLVGAVLGVAALELVLLLLKRAAGI